MKRDMTEKQFESALKRNGIGPCGFMGYHKISKHASVSVWNAGDKRRDQLAYLIAQKRKHETTAYLNALKEK